MDAAIVMKLFFSADIDDLPLEGINPLNEPPGPPPAPRLGQKNPGKHLVTAANNSPFFEPFFGKTEEDDVRSSLGAAPNSARPLIGDKPSFKITVM